jgi:hypothetical protein
MYGIRDKARKAFTWRTDDTWVDLNAGSSHNMRVQLDWELRTIP